MKPGVQTPELYRRFAESEARGWSPTYEDWSLGVAADPDLIARLDELPRPKRQPNLLFAAARYLGVPAGPYADFREAVSGRWSEIRTVILEKRVQTNEPNRCAVLLPLLAALPQPLALLEVGASAGLCLYPDQYSYRYTGHPRLDPRTGPSAAVLDCAVTGPAPIPDHLPDVVWRAGIDLNPLDVNADDDVRWLETLVWPEQDHRRARLAAAVDIARTDPPHLVAGDLNDRLTALAAEKPANATLVVFHTAVLVYLDAAARAAFVDQVRGLDAHWIATEVAGLFPVAAPPSPSTGQLMPLVTLDGDPVAYAAPHGQALHWLPR
jgi:hypothetical protein